METCVLWIKILFIASRKRIHCLGSLRNLFHSQMVVIGNLMDCIPLTVPRYPHLQHQIYTGNPDTRHRGLGLSWNVLLERSKIVENANGHYDKERAQQRELGFLTS